MSSGPVRRHPSSAADAAGGSAEPLDLVFIEGFEASTVIGIHGAELHQPQSLCIDVTIGMPRSPAARSDAIGDTIDYGAVLEALRALMRTHRVRLLEALAEAIARLLLEDFHAHWVQVRIAKPRKFHDTASVGVCIERRRPGGDSPGP
jgi:dihydroneopterin aldolase